MDDLVSGFFVKSCADGSMRLEPIYLIEPLEPGAPPIGVLDRMAVASVLASILNRQDIVADINNRCRPTDTGE